MDYFDIVKRGLRIAWDNKRLWVLGLFVGGAAAAPQPYGNIQALSWQASPAQMEEFERVASWVEGNVALFVVALAALVLLGLVFFMLGFAAEGGLAFAVNEIDEGRSVRLGEAWGAGFRSWGRVFMTWAVLFVPLAVVAVALFVALFVPMFQVIEQVSDPGAAAGVGVGGFCCGLPLLGVVLLAASIIVWIVYQLAVRYGVIDGLGFGSAIKAAWSDLRSKRGALMMWLVMLVPRLIFGAVAGVIALVMLVPAAIAFYEGAVIAGAGVAFLVALVMVVPSAAYSTFESASWTLFFRRMTSKGPLMATSALQEAGYPPQPVPGDVLPPPPPSVEQRPASPSPEVRPGDGME